MSILQYIYSYYMGSINRILVILRNLICLFLLIHINNNLCDNKNKKTIYSKTSNLTIITKYK